MFELRKIRKTDITRLLKVSYILNACGKDMAKKYDLHHWDNTYCKSFIIVGLCALKNDVFLLYNNQKAVATFMTRRHGNALFFEKLGTLPSEAGHGIGTECLLEIEQMAKEQGYYKVVMDVFEASQNAVSFYKHRGYKITGTKGTFRYRLFTMEKAL